MNRYRLLLFIITSICITACNKCAQEPPKVVLVDNPALINEEIGRQLAEKLTNYDTAQTLVILKDSLIATPFIADYYTGNKFTACWTNKGRLTRQGETLYTIIKHADLYGLIAEDYHYSKIDSLIRTARDTVNKKFDAVKLFNAELLMTDAFFKFAVHVSKGRLNADSLTAEWHPQLLDTNLVLVLNAAIKANTIHETIDSLEPQNEQYQKLKKALADYKFEFRNVHWDSLASRESDSTTFTERIKQRLIASHDYVDEVDGADSIKLVKAIKNFQCRRNLTEDGKVGKLTFKAMQQTKEDIIRQIELNMERWRWKDAPSEKQFVWVNIPKYEMFVSEADTLVMRSKVIVGAPDHQTPLLKSTIRYFIIYPYWTVPFSIATKELLPILKRDTAYLRKKNFDVLDANNTIVDPSKINWKRYSKTYFPWKLRQRIGEDNSLGVLKFNFENKYGVYMHDTDARRLFGREMRALSHGCCRLDKFMDFAQFLIRDDSVKYPVDSLKSDLLKEKQKYVYIRHPLPIYINYYTAEVDKNNSLYLFIDVYKRDEKMRKALYKK